MNVEFHVMLDFGHDGDSFPGIDEIELPGFQYVPPVGAVINLYFRDRLERDALEPPGRRLVEDTVELYRRLDRTSWAVESVRVEYKPFTDQEHNYLAVLRVKQVK